MSRRTDRCQVHVRSRRCTRPAELVYLGLGICDVHWSMYADDRAALRQVLGLPADADRLQHALDYAEQLALDTPAGRAGASS